MTKHLSYPLRLLFLLICVFFAPHVQAQITGPASICERVYIRYVDTTSGGSWSSSNPSIATVGSDNGYVFGVSSGAVTISYTTSHSTDVFTASVLATPSAIVGYPPFCVGDTSTLIDSTPGGRWSISNRTVGIIDSVTGHILAVGAGLSIVSYTVGSCAATENMYPGAPPTIYGCNNIGVGDTLRLDIGGSGFSYSISSTTVLSFPYLIGLTPGAATLTVSSSGCSSTWGVTVTPTRMVSPIAGIGYICPGWFDTLSDATPGGIWASRDTAYATISSLGVVHGIEWGGSVISYLMPGSTYFCTAVEGVHPLPDPIEGPSSVCVGDTIYLIGNSYTIFSDVGFDGTFSISDTNIAKNIYWTSGLITGKEPGVATVTYTDAEYPHCSVSTTLTVNAVSVPAILGHTDECVGSSVLLSDALAGGRWSAVNAHATVSGGLVLGASPGTDTITYTIINACGTFPTTRVVTVNPIPSAGIISGADSVCPGAFITLTESVSGGLWHSVNAHATVLSGVVGGVSAGIDTIQYSVTTCATSTVSTVVVVKPLPSAGIISGPAMVCLGSFDTLTESVPGGAWHSSYDTVAAITVSGYVLPAAVGVTNISYLVTNTCGTTVATRSVTVNTEPAVDTIGGAASLCVGATSIYTDVTTGGTWISEDTTLARISSTGTLTGRAGGYATIGYAVTNACGTTTAHTDVTIIALPDTGVIVVPASVCADGTAILYDSVYGGTWHMADTAIATIDSIGIMTARSAGTSLVTYTVSNTCGARSTTATVTIDPLPVAGHITGGMVSLCQGAAITLTDTTTGGIWRSRYSTATIDSSTGRVTGAIIGVDTLSYEVTNGCGTAAAVTVVTINPLPVAASITGASGLCIGSVDTLTDATAGGEWYSSDPTTALVDTNGYVSASGEGTATIYYVVTNGCGTDTAHQAISIDIPVLPITGDTQVCQFSTLTLSDASTGGTWASSDSLAAPVAAGIVLGIMPGTATITYSVTNACGATSASLHVTVLSSSVCGSAVTGAPVAHPSGLAVYPNPNNGACTAHVYTQENEPVLITITDVVGRKLQEYTATTNAEIPVKINTPGIYLITAATTVDRYMAKVVAE